MYILTRSINYHKIKLKIGGWFMGFDKFKKSIFGGENQEDREEEEDMA